MLLSPLDGWGQALRLNCSQLAALVGCNVSQISRAARGLAPLPQAALDFFTSLGLDVEAISRGQEAFRRHVRRAAREGMAHKTITAGGPNAGGTP